MEGRRRVGLEELDGDVREGLLEVRRGVFVEDR